MPDQLDMFDLDPVNGEIRAWHFADGGAATVDPADILREINPDSIPADAPPAEANYRPADMQGIACAFCTKFHTTGFREQDGVMIPTGVCDQWEARVDGVFVSDGYAEDTPPWTIEGKEDWGFATTEAPISYHEIHFAGGKHETRGKKLIKGILRTGHWDETPTPFGKISKPLTIIKDGKSDYDKGIISLSEILANFKARKPLKRVMVPFSDKKNDDHVKDGNLARVNTGFVNNLWLEESDGECELVGEFGFTDPEAEKKVLEGSVDDVSAGVPFHSRFGAFLEHVCLTPTPFIDNLTGWLAASDAPVAEADVVHHVLKVEKPKEDPKPKAGFLSYNQIIDGTKVSLTDQFNLQVDAYEVLDATPERVTIKHNESETTWTAPYRIEDGKLRLTPFAEWESTENAGATEPEKVKEEPEGTTKTEEPPRSVEEAPRLSELEEAQRQRAVQVAASAQTTTATGGTKMTVISKEKLEALDGLSAEEKTAIMATFSENAQLKKASRVGQADARIEELKKIEGLSDRPGALKLYRRIYLSDDGKPACVISFSDDGTEATPEGKTATQILDDFIEALVGSQGKVNFSDQHVESGNDNKPPQTGGEERPVQDRVKDAKEFLYPHGRN